MDMDRQEALDILKNSPAAYLEDGHIQLKCGNHSDTYVHVRLALADRDNSATLGRMLAARFQADQISGVVGFTVGGELLARSVAKHLRAVFAEGELARDPVVNSWLTTAADVFALATDQDPQLPDVPVFFQTIQNRLHYAATGKTAAEDLPARAGKRDPRRRKKP